MAITRTHSPLTLATSVTAATRPTSPPVGTVIMVSDRGNRVEWWDGTNWRYGLSNVSDRKQSSADYSTASTSYVDVTTGLDITLPATTGDVIEVCLNAAGNGHASYSGFIDAVTLVSGSPVNYISGNGSTGLGVQGWRSVQESPYFHTGSPAHYTLVSGDISGGLVTLRLRFKTENAAFSFVIFGASTYAFAFVARNLGPCASGALTAS